MKRIIIAGILSISSTLVGYSQMVGQLFQGTLKPGSLPTTVKAVIKPSASFSGKLSNVQFTFQIANTITPKPGVRIFNNLLTSQIPTANYITQETNEGGFYNYLFAAAPEGQSTDYNFVAGTEIDVLEIQLLGTDVTGGTPVTVRLASLPNGGSVGQLNFYIEVSGNDNTNLTSMFYQSSPVPEHIPVNGGSYSIYSYVAYSPVVLPLKIKSFDVKENKGNAVLNWSVENQTASNSHFEIERSIDGSIFNEIGRLAVLSTTSRYSYTDANISKTRNNGLLYYRLKQVDQDGQYIYSEVKKVQVIGSFSFGIAGNPVKAGNLSLIIQSPLIGNGTLRIFNAKGDIVHQSNISWTNGYSQHPVSLTNSPAGNYTANLMVGGKQYYVKFIKVIK